MPPDSNVVSTAPLPEQQQQRPRRWPLRYQIMLPMAVVLVLAVVGVSVTHAMLAAGRARATIERELREVARTLDQSTFPLTDAVLRQMRGLSGADFILRDSHGNLLARSSDDPQWADLTESETDPSGLGFTDQGPGSRLRLGQPIRLPDGQGYFRNVIQLAPRRGDQVAAQLTVLYPEATYRQAWRDAVLPSVLVGLLALAIVGALAVVVANRVGAPMSRLQGQVEQISRGKFEPIPLPQRNDEVQDLAKSVNRMAQTLARYDAQVRRTERLRTLGQLGGGIAHQLRNSATGCRMALDLHARDCPQGENDEALLVAKRQLILMEKYVQRFLTIGKPAAQSRARVELDRLIDDLLPLVRPAAAHGRVDLRWIPPAADSCGLLADSDGLEQLIVNLLLNAIEAASRGPSPSSERLVIISLLPQPDQLCLIVEDSGQGPDPQVADDVFEPLVTEKPEGAGLGLAVARDVAEAHGGTIRWERTEQAAAARTRLIVELPTATGKLLDSDSTLDRDVDSQPSSSRGGE